MTVIGNRPPVPSPTPATAELAVEHSLDPERLRQLFRRQASGIAIVTASHAGRPVGLLVNSLASVSARPPFFSFNVARTASAWPALAGVDHLGVHLLDADQQDVAERFSRSGADRFSPPSLWQRGPHNVPVLSGVAGWAIARVEHRFAVADHVIVVARTLQAGFRTDSRPLLYHDGAYHHATPSTVRDAPKDSS